MEKTKDSKILEHNRYSIQLQLLIGSIIAFVLAIKELAPMIFPDWKIEDVLKASISIAFIISLAGFLFLNNKMNAIEREFGKQKDETKEPSSLDVLLMRDSIKIVHRDSKGKIKKTIEQ